MRTDTPTARGSVAVRRALEAEVHDAQARGVAQPRVVDVGGGSGVWAVALAGVGCRTTVVEPNPNALATLQRRAREEGVADRITAVADDSDSLTTHIPAGSADLVLAHGLLEIVEDPVSVVEALAATVAPDGAVSVLAANRHAAVLHRALAGRLSEARQLLEDVRGVLVDDGDTVLRRLSTGQLQGWLTTAGLEISLIQGDGVLPDTLPADAPESAEQARSWEDELAAFELEAASAPPLRDIATRLHALARRRR